MPGCCAETEAILFSTNSAVTDDRSGPQLHCEEGHLCWASHCFYSG